jgi:hypothetical protein
MRTPTLAYGDNFICRHCGAQYRVRDNDKLLAVLCGRPQATDGKLVSDIVIDTSITATDTIDYVGGRQCRQHRRLHAYHIIEPPTSNGSVSTTNATSTPQ